MYEQYFNLAENPFTIAPNPRYFYLSDQHREALAHLQYGLNESGERRALPTNALKSPRGFLI